MKSIPVSKKKSITTLKNSISELNNASGDKSEKSSESTGHKIANFTVVAIGASAGGLEAITQLLHNLAPNTGMAYIYVQHLSPDHKSMLTSLLSNATEMKVQDVEDMEKMEPNNVYVIPYNKEIVVTNGHIQLIPRSNIKTYNKSIDVLFSSLALTHKSNVIGVVLSGSATDGTKGLREIKLAGGTTFAQDESAKFRSMPLSAIGEGVVDYVLSPKEIALKLSELGQSKDKETGLSLTEIKNDDQYFKFIIESYFKGKRCRFQSL